MTDEIQKRVDTENLLMNTIQDVLTDVLVGREVPEDEAQQALNALALLRTNYTD